MSSRARKCIHPRVFLVNQIVFLVTGSPDSKARPHDSRKTWARSQRRVDCWYMSSRAHRVAIVRGLVFLFLYVALFMRFVRSREVPSKGTTVQISVGFERAEFAKANFNGDRDWEILRFRGTDEEQVSKLWTIRSLMLCPSLRTLVDECECH